MVKGLAERIRRMAEIVDEEHIARALNIPLEVVRGVLTGEVPDEALEDYDPARPPDVRVVEKKKFVRSRSIGVASTGGCGATTLAASLAVLAAERSKGPVAAVDLNEFSGLGRALGLDVTGERAAFYPNVSWWEFYGAEECLVEHPAVAGLNIALGAATAERYLELKGEVVSARLKEISGMHAITFVDFPSWPGYWKELLPLVDVLLFVVRPDAASLYSLWQAAPVLKGIEDAVGVVISGDGLEGCASAAECRRALKKIADVPVVAVLPDDPAVRRASLGGRCFALEHPGSPYCRAVAEILEELLPDAGSSQKKQGGVLGALAELFRRG